MNALRSSFGVESDEDPPFVYPPSQNLFCPICHELYKKPVITKECSHSFCEMCLFQIENGSCPLCRRKFIETDVHQNLVLDQLVKELPVYCKYRKNGCNEQLPLSVNLFTKNNANLVLLSVLIIFVDAHLKERKWN